MKIRVRYFASVRELIGGGAATVELPAGATVEDALAMLAEGMPRREQLLSACLPMVNQEYVDRRHRLSDGDELALIPPVSGGSGFHFEITDEPLDSGRIERLIATPGSGAVVLFVGTVRDHARDRKVLRLEYEAYAPAAEKMLARIGDEIRDRWSVDRVAIVHRTGTLEIGEASVVIGVSSPHRAEAFDACRHAIERIKQIVPIWKKEWYEGGSAWIGSEAEYQQELAAAGRQKDGKTVRR
jgi:molybdopterin synthase catalytic subunit